MQTTVVPPWKVGTHRGLNHGGKHYPFGEPVPGIETLPNLMNLVDLHYLVPNTAPIPVAETGIGEETVAAHAKEEQESLAESKKPPRKRKNMLRKRAPRRRKKAEISAEA